MKIEQESGDFFEESFSNSKKLDQTQDNSEDRRTKPIIRNSKIRESMKPNFKKIKLEASKNSIRQQDEGEKHKEKDDDDFFNDTIGEDDFQFDEPIDLKIDNNVDIAYESHKNQNRNTNTANKSKLALQRKKVRAVHKIIELKIEKYDFLDLSAACKSFNFIIAQYQAYLAKLTDGRVKNSSEQTNDEDQQVGCQTEDGGQAEYACQFPEISLPPPIVDETAQGKRLKVFLKEESDLIEEILVYSEKTTGTSKQMYELEIPYCIKKICQDPILDQSTVLQISKAQTFVLVHVQTC